MTKWFIPEKKKEDNTELKVLVSKLRRDVEYQQLNINAQIAEIEKLLKEK